MVYKAFATILAPGEPYGVVPILLLIGLLVTKELISLSGSKHAVRLGKIINIAILPLLVISILIIVGKIGALIQ